MIPRDLDPAQLRAYVQRDWRRLDDLDCVARANQPLETKMRIGVELYEAARATLPGWPTVADRAADLAHHIAVRSILRRVAHVRPR